MDLGGLWNGRVVPLRQDLIKADRDSLFEVISNFATGLVKLINDSNGDSQTLTGFGLGHQLANKVKTLENDALASSGDMGEEAMFNRIILRAYPNNPAPRKAMRAQAKCKKAI